MADPSLDASQVQELAQKTAVAANAQYGDVIYNPMARGGDHFFMQGGPAIQFTDQYADGRERKYVRQKRVRQDDGIFINKKNGKTCLCHYVVEFFLYFLYSTEEIIQAYSDIDYIVYPYYHPQYDWKQGVFGYCRSSNRERFLCNKRYGDSLPESVQAMAKAEPRKFLPCIDDTIKTLETEPLKEPSCGVFEFPDHIKPSDPLVYRQMRTAGLRFTM